MPEIRFQFGFLSFLARISNQTFDSKISRLRTERKTIGGGTWRPQKSDGLALRVSKYSVNSSQALDRDLSRTRDDKWRL